MKQSITLLVLSAVVFGSCTTAYKTGQTPDDVYYSPGRPSAEYVQVEDKKEEERPVQYSEDYYEDRFLRMRIEDRYRWSALDDYYFRNAYAYNSFGNYFSLNSPWNSYFAWNCHYNPYYGGIPYYPGRVITKNPMNYNPPSRAVVFNPNSYIIRSAGTSSIGSKSPGSYNSRYNNNNRNSNGLGESIRKVFSNSNNSSGYDSGSNSSTPSRSYSPSSGGSSSSGGGRSSGGGGGVSRPSR